MQFLKNPIKEKILKSIKFTPKTCASVNISILNEMKVSRSLADGPWWADILVHKDHMWVLWRCSISIVSLCTTGLPGAVWFSIQAGALSTLEPIAASKSGVWLVYFTTFMRKIKLNRYFSKTVKSNVYRGPFWRLFSLQLSSISVEIELSCPTPDASPKNNLFCIWVIACWFSLSVSAPISPQPAIKCSKMFNLWADWGRLNVLWAE